MINPWNKPAIPLNAATQMPHPLQAPRPMRNPLGMSPPPSVPFGTIRPATSTFMPGTGVNTTHQAHPYVDTMEKKDQKLRDAKAPTRSFNEEGMQR